MAIQDPLTGLIIGCCYRVANELGNGFLEKVYERALAHELRKAKVKVVQQQGIEVFYDGVNVGDYEADLIVSLDFGGRTAFPEGRPGHCGGEGRHDPGRCPHRPMSQLHEGYAAGDLPPGQLRQSEDPGAAIGYDQGGFCRGG